MISNSISSLLRLLFYQEMLFLYLFSSSWKFTDDFQFYFQFVGASFMIEKCYIYTYFHLGSFTDDFQFYFQFVAASFMIEKCYIYTYFHRL